MFSLTQPAVASPPALSLAFRTWTFSELGFGADTFRPVHGFDRPTVSYALPSAVKQGKNGWWIISLHLRVRTRSVPPGRTAIIGAEANRIGCVYISLTGIRTARGPAVRWTSVGIVTGTSSGVAYGRSFDLSFSNYLPYPGVVPGANTLEWILRDGGLASSVTILPTSGLIHSRLAPTRIALQEIVDQPPRVGKPLRVTAILRNLGGMDARHIVVSLELQPGGFIPISPTHGVVRRLRHGDVARIPFTVSPLAPGRQPLGISATSNSNQSAALVTVDVRRTSSTSGWQRPWFGLWYLMAIAAIATAASRAATRSSVLATAGVSAAGTALFWLLIRADASFLVGVALSTGAATAWARRFWSSKPSRVAVPSLAVAGLS